MLSDRRQFVEPIEHEKLAIRGHASWKFKKGLEHDEKKKNLSIPN